MYDYVMTSDREVSKMQDTPNIAFSNEFAVFESGTNDQLTEVMTNMQCRNWVRDAYAEGETRTLCIRYMGRVSGDAS